MKVSRNHLTYCTNIHPGESRSETLDNVKQHVVAVKSKFCPAESFGVGLRLSNCACEEFLRHGLDELHDMCRENDLYVFTINGFIYGHFHKKPVKQDVYLPDWSATERVEFSNNLAQILADLLPQEINGTISTVPVGFKNRFTTRDTVEKAAQNLLQHLQHLYAIKKRSGKNIMTCLEPEPGCYIETIDETIAFFREYIFTEKNYQAFSAHTGLALNESAAFIKNHLGICYDTCHMAIEYEQAQHALQRLQQNEIRVGKVQISSAIKMCFSSTDAEISECLQPYVDPIYLHQVVEDHDGIITRFNDLPLALQSLKNRNVSQQLEWRIHFHIPIFVDSVHPLIQSTQQHIIDTLDYLKQHNICEHLEVETYTWEVLPQKYRQVSLHDSITRELQWALQQIRS
ncbi:metabolite traffic protein EboE [Candidatus Uabimicrobium amorphum]|uniref:Sugar phosphate isomerase n=1 Tax=Uabimicrobium amorphum TaxID=2596890 RepID=A0A5S9IKL5_UABAM|nr:metabolite traffic protein EboE [Candidatus Uabimicrobium amorphum]BBM83271.1 sugar phosphate isomerase [Candidatus Uabimicrobium amorphum]